MPAATTKRSGVNKLTSGFTTVYTVQVNYWSKVTMIHLVNTTAAPVTVQLCSVAPGGTPTQDNALMWNFSIPANDLIELGDGYWMSSQMSLAAKCSVDGAINLIWSLEEE